MTATRSRTASTRPRRPRSWAWRHRRALFSAGLVAFFFFSLALFLLARAELPPEEDLAETTFLTDINGHRLASIDAGENRVPVPLERVPVVLVQAVLATEDRNFYDHSGLDPVGIIRATIADLRGRSLQGGSTITQQYVKNAYEQVGRQRTVWRKLKEASVAVKVERRLNKDEILERYLNTVYFGRGAYGVQAASRVYFGKDVDALGLPEAAYLAGLIRAPETGDVAVDPGVARRRRDRTLAAMREEGFITADQRRRAEAVPLTGERGYVLDREEQEPEVVATDKGTQYFVDYVLQELVRRYGEAAAKAGGLRVRTTLDLRLQAEAYDAIYGVLDRPDDPVGGLVAIDFNGNVRAMVGGRNYTESKVNVALGKEGGGSGRQAGSTFKPFLLGAVVREGYSVRSAFPAPAEITLPKADSGRDYEVSNYENQDYDGLMSLIEATQKSVNTVYVHAQYALGDEKVVAMAKDAGVTAELAAVPSLALGTVEVSILDMASAYSTFANRGVRVRPRAIVEVRRADGTVLDWAGDERTRVMERDDADVVNHVLKLAVRSGTGVNARVRGTDIAGKTGTTNDYGDAWFVGYTPKLTAAVWMGHPTGRTEMRNVRGQRVSGGSFPAVIFRRFMSAAIEDHNYRGQFPLVTRFPGKILNPSEKVEFVTTTTTTDPPTTTVPDEAGTASSTTVPPSPTTTARSATTTTQPPATTTTAPADGDQDSRSPTGPSP